jgi:hypothetical protein
VKPGGSSGRSHDRRRPSKAEVLADSSGKWAGNDLVFRTRDEAERGTPPT